MEPFLRALYNAFADENREKWLLGGAGHIAAACGLQAAAPFLPATGNEQKKSRILDMSINS